MFFKPKDLSAVSVPDAHALRAGEQDDTGVAGVNASKQPSVSATGKWYLQQALQFEASKQEQQAKLTRLAWRVAGAAGVLAAVSILGATALVQLKRPNPPAVLRVDASTGRVDVLNAVPDGREIFNEKNNRADLRRYVELRESYDWETIQDMFNTVKLMTADK
jgi:type IV secretion system protein VirB8